MSVDDIIYLHDRLVSANGGSFGIRDYGLLESALCGCYQSFNGIELYPSPVEKAAWLVFSLCKNHPFVDGNKRTAVSTMVIFLQTMDLQLQYSQQDLINLALDIDNNRITYEEIVTWIKTRL